MGKLLLWIWCFPQMFIGLLVKIFTRARKVNDHYEYNLGGCVSLGEYVFLGPGYYNDEEVLKHEKGHTIQSKYLGWLYLLVIGLPSFIWANSKYCKKYRQKHKISYYSFYTERWANKLGGVHIE